MGTTAAACRAELLALCTAAPPNGVGASAEEAAGVEAAAAALSTFCSAEPARQDLSGVWELVYTATAGGSSGKVGPFVGKVTQEMVDDTAFVNAVELFGGALRVALRAEREVLDAERIRVTFKEMVFSLFGMEVLRKPTGGAGVWRQRYVDEGLRVMDTPSLFVLRRRDEA